MIVKEFLRMVKALPEIELAAIVGTKRSQEKLVSIQAENQIGEIFTDFDQCLNEAEFDTVYVAVPNHLHFEFAKKALENGKNVICEKPFTLNLAQFMELKAIALEKGLVLVEAITNQYLENYQVIKDVLPRLGELKIMECNYSQYSSRYDQFKAGVILPAFNPQMGGGALMDINIYNIHFVIGLLGKPESVTYLANIEKGIDTSGILILNYPQTKVICIGAKDSAAAIRSTIQGNKGSVIINGPTSTLMELESQINGQESQKLGVDLKDHRMFPEFKEFLRMITEQDLDEVRKQLNHSQLVMEVVELALADAGIELG